MTMKLNLTIEDLEDRIAPDLLLPNGNTIFVDHDNPAPGDCHPSLENEANVSSNWHGWGPWSATDFFRGDGHPIEYTNGESFCGTLPG